MTAAGAIQPFDARSVRGLTPVSRRTVDHWLTEAAARTTEALTEFCPQAALKYAGLSAYVAVDALAKLADPDIGAMFTVGKQAVTTVLSMKSAALLAVLHGMLGVESDQWPEDRPLSPVEGALAELLFDRVQREFSEAWPQREPMPFVYERFIVRTARARLFDPQAVLALASFSLVTACGAEPVQWIGLVDELEQLGNSETPVVSPRPATNHRIADLAPLVPMPLTIELGRAQLSVSEADSLRCGDVLLLDQKIHGLLTARVAGQPKYQGRPGRLGSRLCFSIEAFVED